MDVILKLLVPGIPISILVIFLILLVPEKIEKWSALLWKAIASLGGLIKGAHKRYVKHDLQGRVNEFVKKLGHDVPSIGQTKLRVEWVDSSTQRKAFLEGNEVVLRLRREDPGDENFVHGAYFFVSETLLRKSKRYASPSQREALDLFVCTKLLEAEKPSVVEVFLDSYLHPKMEDRKGKIALYVDNFEMIHQAGFFFPLLVQELEFLGDKVFGKRRDHLIVKEVDDVVDLLRPIATRTIGEESDLNFSGAYCRFDVVIIGKPSKLLTSIEPYVGYIRKVLATAGTETIYLLSRSENKQIVDNICGRFTDKYECVRRLEFRSVLRYPDRKEQASQYLAVLRRRGIGIIQASA